MSCSTDESKCGHVIFTIRYAVDNVLGEDMEIYYTKFTMKRKVGRGHRPTPAGRARTCRAWCTAWPAGPGPQCGQRPQGQCRHQPVDGSGAIRR